MQQLLANYLVNAAWQIPVVALCALLVSRVGGFTPQGRNRLWLLFLAIAAVLPAVSLAALLPHAEPTLARVPAERYRRRRPSRRRRQRPTPSRRRSSPPWN